jgi:thioredoxin-like negative regulator of GroEL
MIVVKDLSPADFSRNRVEGPAFVFFYATWCSHCKRFAPVYQKIADIVGGVIKTYRADVDKVKGVADALGVKAVPTIVFFPEGDMSPVTYDGDLSWRGVLNFLNRRDCKSGNPIEAA